MSISLVEVVQSTRIKNIFDKHMSKTRELHKIIELELSFLTLFMNSKADEDNNTIINDIPNIPATGINPFIKKLSIEV